MSSSLVRSFFTSFSHGGSSFFMVVAGLCGHTHSDVQLASVLCASLFYGMSHAGVMVTPLDLGPPGVAGPLFAGLETARALSGESYK